MNHPTNDELTDFLVATGAQSCRVVDLPTGHTQAVGDLTVGLPLLRVLIGTPSACRVLDSSLAGQLMPRVWTQGADSCVVWKPTADTLLLSIYLSLSGGSVEAYRKGKEAAGRVQALFRGA